jgi:uncharacterized membrane protein YkoI
MASSIRTKLVAAGAIAAAALGGSVVANAATTTSTTASGTATQTQARHDPSMGGHQANGKTETLLTGTTASKVEAAAKAKYPGATIQRVETDADTGSAYEAHLTKADGSDVIVYVNSSFEVTGTGTMGHP